MHIPRDPKAMAKNLRQALAERRIEITHSDSLEFVARQLGWRDWNTLAARLDRPPLRMPEGWNVGGTRGHDYEMGLDPEKGCAVIRYSGNDAEPMPGNRRSGFGTLMQRFRADAYRGKRLQLQAELKADAVTGAATIWLRIDGNKTRALAFDNMEERQSEGPLTGTVEWQDRSIVLDVPPDARSIHFGFYLRGDGSVWARRFRFAEVDASIEVTDDPTPQRAAPTNLDFAAVA
ncbi:glyoxalase superfamily protein [Methylobacterium sp. NPDC080182]|uniref:glyoxalase superfamily protein n=1 Tax=Methylobacterium sp. NPDC080182 TaxID=3390590 RepID=UPI003D07AC94